MRRSFLLATSLLFFFSCNKQKEEPPIAPARMEAIVLDLELADALAMTPGAHQPDSMNRVYRELIFKKHNLSETAYQKHLDWYYQHPAVLDSVYTHVKNKLDDLNNVKVKK